MGEVGEVGKVGEYDKGNVWSKAWIINLTVLYKFINTR